ncbi:EH domain-containing protein 1-like isoform X3 [Convolutriloba macropyga]|uniref:EH domain-containing protein 1-like isoform X3 n=1 Tax=Convolutriloba macropyga TaxID=536237 RepID=UPI003F52356F
MVFRACNGFGDTFFLWKKQSKRSLVASPDSTQPTAKRMKISNTSNIQIAPKSEAVGRYLTANSESTKKKKQKETASEGRSRHRRHHRHHSQEEIYLSASVMLPPRGDSRTTSKGGGRNTSTSESQMESTTDSVKRKNRHRHRRRKRHSNRSSVSSDSDSSIPNIKMETLKTPPPNFNHSPQTTTSTFKTALTHQTGSSVTNEASTSKHSRTQAPTRGGGGGGVTSSSDQLRQMKEETEEKNSYDGGRLGMGTSTKTGEKRDEKQSQSGTTASASGGGGQRQESGVGEASGNRPSDDKTRRETQYSTASNYNMFREFRPFEDDEVDMVIKRLHEFYGTRPVRVEEQLRYYELIEPQLTEVYFRHKPIVLVVGEANSGKTSFINFLLGSRHFIGSQVDAERSTTGFSIIDKGREDERVSGRNLVSDPKRPFRDLHNFGNDFLENLHHVLVSDAHILENCYLVDTPGLLKGSTKARDGYEMKEVIKWFASVADSIMLVWDAQVWRMSDSLIELFRDCLSKHHSKLCIVLNKCDLLRVEHCMAGHVPFQNNTRKVVANQILWMVAKFFNTYYPVKFYNVSTMKRPLANNCDLEVIDISHDQLFRNFLLMRRNRAINIVQTLETRLRRCYALVIIIREVQSKLGNLRKAKRKQQLLNNFWKFLQDLDAKCKPPFQGVIKNHVNAVDLKYRLERYDFNHLPKMSVNQILVAIEESLNEVIRIIPNKFLDIKLDVPDQHKQTET